MSTLIHKLRNTSLDAPYVMRCFDFPSPIVQFLDGRWPTISDPTTGEKLGHIVGSLTLSEIEDADPRQGIDIDTTGGWPVGPAPFRDCLHALRSAGILPEPDEGVSGYLLIMAEEPMCGIRQQPAYTPSDDGGHDARSWFEAYGCVRTLAEAQSEAKSDHKAATLAVEQGDLEDVGEPDFPMPVRVYPDGSVAFLDFSSPEPEADEVCRHSADLIYGAFGMSRPQIETVEP